MNELKRFVENWSFYLLLTILFTLQSCDNVTNEKIEISEFMKELLESFIHENPEISKKNEIVNVDIIKKDFDIIISIIAYEKELFPDIDSCFIGTYNLSNTIFVFSGQLDSILLTKPSYKKHCKYSRVKHYPFEYDPIYWKVWLYKNYEFNEFKTIRINPYENIDNIRRISSLLEIDSSMTISKKYYNEPIVLIDNPTKYKFGYDSLYNYITSKVNVKEFLNNSKNNLLTISCIIDSTGTVEKIEFYPLFENNQFKEEIQKELIGLSDFTIPTHRKHKVKSKYSLIFRKEN